VITCDATRHNVTALPKPKSQLSGAVFDHNLSKVCCQSARFFTSWQSGFRLFLDVEALN
jgi:hypothetical protein